MGSFNDRKKYLVGKKKAWDCVPISPLDFGVQFLFPADHRLQRLRPSQVTDYEGTKGILVKGSGQKAESVLT